MKKLSRREAWVKIRDAFADFQFTRKKNMYTAAGMCYAVDELHYGREINGYLAQDMLADIKAFNPPGLIMWWWPATPEGAANRVAWIDAHLARIDAENKPTAPNTSA